MALPAVQLLETPIQQLDKFLCKSLDVVEKRVPSIYLPPQMMYSETREYVLRRADSVKQLGTAVLDSRMTAVTATALERALTTADKYVDKYLPPDYQDAADVVIIVTSAEGEGGEAGAPCEESGRACAAHAVKRGARLRRKLQRRLTRQALAEAKAIKEQIHVLVYVAELVATDPALAWKKAKQLYASLSCPEPENQARPATLEELVVLLARETARKVVHLVNYTHTDLPNNMRQGMSLVSKHLSTAANALLKALPVDSAMSEVRNWRCKVQALLHQLQETSKTYLHLAIFLAGNEEREKITPRSTYAQRDDLSAINGVN
ncbi:PREDICTED: lipid storage droplets surface-binding protein 1 isoform X2 [Papilio polytes]|uniref:lipid storage droplets surface-binding protein 1 isoform X2 n=1 Tax=Papilio polytes TaxID=76194 RepID=UPI000676050B|nr:PREDICTED: lipid storage droplets surface-binding protein 1 isoform X2 [Papilio polytes]